MRQHNNLILGFHKILQACLHLMTFISSQKNKYKTPEPRFGFNTEKKFPVCTEVGKRITRDRKWQTAPTQEGNEGAVGRWAGTWKYGAKLLA